MMTKGLEELYKLKELIEYSTDLDSANWANKIDTIEKELKVLEIIKNKRVDFDIICQSICIEDYNQKTRNCFFKRPLKQEEFNLLKEVL